MAIYAFRKEIRLQGGSLWIIREDRNPFVSISYSTAEGDVKKRLTLELTAAQAMSVAKTLAGILDMDETAFDEEDTEPGKKTPA